MRRTLLLSAAVLAGLALPAAADPQSLTLLSMNMWGAGANAQKPIDETVAVFKAVNADIIAVQETVPEPDPCTAEVCQATENSRLKDLADALGYHYHEFKHNTDNHWADGVLSKYPFGQETPNGVGVEIDVNGRKIVVYSMNLDDAPYQPYQLLNIEYDKSPFIKTAAEAEEWASKTRGKALELLVADIKAEEAADAQFVMGDFNEPSHWDWTENAVKAGHQPLAVNWPTTRGVEAQGFVDTFRTAFPDEVAKPGMTWTPTTSPDDKEDHHDRIDFILAKSKELKVISAGIVGEKAPEADLVVTPWPSDHRATMAKVAF
ncbi:endonuclease/exonuclease/phosphatase family protein [Aestuariivirga sp.]|uniref:endonuclease/exonuclease/phosphatase family protein n=1 Tax=Aestuariivirga sp. TaxID=2650926 RepID=UPI0039E492A4